MGSHAFSLILAAVMVGLFVLAQVLRRRRRRVVYGRYTLTKEEIMEADAKLRMLGGLEPYETEMARKAEARKPRPAAGQRP
jgi:hypothetical protein